MKIIINIKKKTLNIKETIRIIKKTKIRKSINKKKLMREIYVDV